MEILYGIFAGTVVFSFMCILRLLWMASK